MSFKINDKVIVKSGRQNYGNNFAEMRGVVTSNTGFYIRVKFNNPLLAMSIDFPFLPSEIKLDITEWDI